MPSIAFKDIVSNCCERVAPSDEGNVPYIGLEHIGADSFTVPILGNSQEVKGQKFKMKKGDVLFGRRRAYQKKVAIAPCDGIFSAHGMIFRPKSTIIQELLPFFIRSDAFMNKAISLSVGSLSPTLNWGAIKDVQFSIPELESQFPIAELLWAIEEDIELINQQICQMDLLIKSRFIEMFGTPTGNEKQWPTEKMKEVAPPIQADNKPMSEGNWLLNLDAIQSNSGEILFKNRVSDSDLNGSIMAFSSEHVLYSKLRPYLNKVAVPDEPGYGTTELIPLLPDKSKLTRLYLAHLLRSDTFVSKFSSAVAGTKMPRVSMDVFWKFEVPVPPIDLQQDFGSFVEQVNKSKFELQKHLEDTKKLQKALINQAFKQ